MKKSYIRLILAIIVSFGLLLYVPTAIKATLPLELNTGWQWEVNNYETLIYHIEDNFFGSRYEAYNITGEPWVSYGFLDVLNITKLKFNQLTGSVENSDEVFQCAVSLASGFWQLSFWDGGDPAGGLTMAFPLIPVNTSGLINQTQLDAWGSAMTNNQGGTTYARALQLQEYVVVSDNELHLYNSTSPTFQYVNLTYNNNGILETAYVNVEIDTGESIILLDQSITRETGDVNSLLNPIDETTVAVNAGDSLIYQFSMNGIPQVYRSYNITYVGEIMGEYQGSKKLFWGANATRYNFDPSTGTWIIDPELIDQTVGGGDDNYLFLQMDGPTNIIHPVGTNGSILERNLAPMFGSVHGGFLDTSETGDWWVKFSNTTTGQWIRIELEPNTGILLNVSFTQGNNVLMEYLIRDVNGLLNPIDETTVAVNVGDSLIYQFSENGVHQVYRSYNITYVGEITGEYQGSKKLFWGANATRYNFDPTEGTWIIDPEWTEQTVGGGDDNYLFLRMDGPTNIIHPVGTNGSILEWNLAPIFGSVHGGFLDTSETGDWWVKFSNTTTGQWIRIELEPNTGILLNVSFTYGNDILMEYLIDEDDFPPMSEDLIPKATFIANSTTIFEGEWVQFNFTGSPGDLPIDGQWNFGDGSAISTIENPTHQYTTAGTYTVTLTIIDNDGDIDVYSMNITVNPIVDTTSTSTSTSTSSTSEESEEESGGVTPSFGISISIISIIGIILLKKKH
ncbi:MAG: PKD domain-containing protein [Promethearchaeota archaeon]